ncbi:MAG: heat shock protein, Hsp20 family [Candidatus Ozemobacter sibiricus]|jgi:HSP20 family molecular chaperone IbpA|uniref:Heat shock protein, Hsp20 family n=1 Tax=Candidatus Ozemobacter sibiricus TaxID=2268124 RepID=A0A367ZSN7_9BACT|nr:MAG: heat shock protein, Hsp20 family [Candidatus Ozemobacter sibiricus]
MQKIIPTSIPEVKSSLEALKNAFTSSLHQLVAKGNELQQVAEHLMSGAVARDFPRCDMVEGSGELFVLFELPGLAREDFQLEIGGGLLTVRGEKKSRLQGRGAVIHLGECLYGAFERTVSLPVRVAEDKAAAEFTAGVLIVTLPKAEAGDRPRHPIPIR